MELLCVKPHSSGVLTVGNFYPLHGTKKTTCCNLELVDIGMKSDNILRCKCGSLLVKTDNARWFGAALFASCEESELTELVTELELQS